jgi:hypothetical protein
VVALAGGGLVTTGTGGVDEVGAGGVDVVVAEVVVVVVAVLALVAGRLGPASCAQAVKNATAHPRATIAGPARRGLVNGAGAT